MRMVGESAEERGGDSYCALPISVKTVCKAGYWLITQCACAAGGKVIGLSVSLSCQSVHRCRAV